MEAGKPADVSKGKYGPESRMFDALKGAEVLISWNNGDPGMRAKLIWVDRYTLGVKLRNGSMAMVYKLAIKFIEAGDQKDSPQP
jgi:sRNA-binding regulator protein Hfq